MKKNFTVNISGVLFHIDEDAYKRLNQYVDSLKIHFNNDPGKDEIISDIESRVAEMLHEMTAAKGNVVSLDDIEKAIAAMGQPFEIEGEEDPEVNYKKRKDRPKRLFRDPDNKLIGGVCSGMGAYFNVDSIWFRLLFVALVVAGGAGLLAYLIFWIAVPEAQSTAERLEMKGKPVNIENIEKTVKEEFGHLTDRVNEMAHQAKDSFKKKSKQGKTPLEQLIAAIAQVVRLFVRLVGGLVGVVLLLFGFSIIATFGVFFFFQDALPVDDNMFFSVPHFFDMLFSSPLIYTLSVVGATLLIGIPLMSMVFLGIRLVFNVRISAKSIGIPATLIWFGSLFLCATLALIISKDFRMGAEEERKYTLNNDNKTWELDMSSEVQDNIQLHGEEFIVMDWGNTQAKLNSYFLGSPNIRFSKTTKDEAYIMLTYEGRGRNMQEANENISGIRYDLDVSDSVIHFDRFFQLSSDQKWRAQEVHVRVYLPEGTKVVPTAGFAKYQDRWIYGFHGDPKADREYIMTDDGMEIIEEMQD
ncbi:MAG: PspC domain-containing protein [Bacteroidales bacterium]|nr:PspC domain-containing protein [Bacteroidales bacterium]